MNGEAQRYSSRRYQKFNPLLTQGFCYYKFVKVNYKELPWVDESIKIIPTAIVLHWWQVPDWFGGIDCLIKGLKRWNTSVQFAVTKNCEIYQLVKDPRTLCHHARAASNSSIGIEIQGRNSKSLDKNIDQFKAVLRLVKYLQKEYKIQTSFKVTNLPELRFFGVTSHKEVDPYCGKRLLRYKRDVHDEYLARIRASI